MRSRCGAPAHGVRTCSCAHPPRRPAQALLVGGLRPKLVYCIPAFSNPTAVTMTHGRRQDLVRLAAAYDFTVLADEVYQLLSLLVSHGEAPVQRGGRLRCHVTVPPAPPRVQPDPAAPAAAPLPPPLCYYDTTGHVISMGSFAKIAAPALRLGWFQFSEAGRPLLKRIYGCGQLDSSGGLNPVIAGLVERFIDSGDQDKHVRVCVRACLHPSQPPILRPSVLCSCWLCARS